MDTILSTPDILDGNNWLYFKLYKDPASKQDWKSNLDWYHKVLIDTVKPIVDAQTQIRVVFFGTYGPDKPTGENETYERQLPDYNFRTSYIRLRLSVVEAHKNVIKTALTNQINSNNSPVWNHERMLTYNVRGDLGTRYGSGDANQTLNFIRYWDAACRYILSVLTLPGNWLNDVDVWGIPHLVNNSLGAMLRTSSLKCPYCGTSQNMMTSIVNVNNLPPNLRAMLPHFQQIPVFVFLCPRCGQPWLNSINI